MAEDKKAETKKKESKTAEVKDASGKPAKKISQKTSQKTSKKTAITILLVVGVCGVFGYGYLLEATDKIKQQFKPTQVTMDIKKTGTMTATKLPIQPIDFEEEATDVDILPTNIVDEIAVTAPRDNFSPEHEASKNVFGNIAKRTGVNANDDLPEKVVENADKVQVQEKLLLRQQVLVSPTSNFTQSPKVLSQIKEQQKLIVLYIAARDLKDSIDKPAEFTAQLGFLKNVSKNFPQIQGKVDLLGHASVDGIPTVDSLQKEIKIIAQDAEDGADKSVWESLEDSLQDIVKVTKIEGQGQDGSHYAAYKKVERALANDDLEAAIKAAEAFGEDAEGWVMKVKNLQRIIENADDIVGFSRGNLGA